MDGKVITYEEMKKVADFRLQRGINFKPNRQDISYLLMSQRQDAPYRDSIETDGSILYEGHDVRKTKNVQNPKSIYQPKYNKNGSLSQNGHFYEAAIKYKAKKIKLFKYKYMKSTTVAFGLI